MEPGRLGGMCGRPFSVARARGQPRRVAMQLGAAVIGAEHRLVAFDLLEDQSGAKIPREDGAIVLAAWHDLEPQLRHLIGCALSVRDALRRTIRVEWVLRRVVV